MSASKDLEIDLDKVVFNEDELQESVKHNEEKIDSQEEIEASDECDGGGCKI
jgi:hypothetical protein